MGVLIIQKQHERFLIERFFERLGSKARIIEERECPDFIAYMDGREIGIELTELFISHGTNSHILQAQETISDKIVSRAKFLYQESSAPPAHVSICFNSSVDLRSINRDDISVKLSSLISSLNLDQWQRFDWRPDGFRESQLDKAISFIHALGVPSNKMAHWTAARAGWVAPLTSQKLQARIDEKTKKLKKYQQVVPEIWLVIIANCMKPSQLFSAEFDFEPNSVNSEFSKTFYYGYPDGAFIELGVK